MRPYLYSIFNCIGNGSLYGIYSPRMAPTCDITGGNIRIQEIFMLHSLPYITIYIYMVFFHLQDNMPTYCNYNQSLFQIQTIGNIISGRCISSKTLYFV